LSGPPSTHRRLAALRYLIFCAIIFLISGDARAASTRFSATAHLGSTGIRATLVEMPITLDAVAMHRVLMFSKPGFKHLTVKLNEDNQDLNSSTNLYVAKGGHYIFVSRKDCVDLDTSSFDAQLCEQQSLKREDLLYLGRFDWMNGFDKNVFQLGFRFQGSDHAHEDLSIWQNEQFPNSLW